MITKKAKKRDLVLIYGKIILQILAITGNS